MPPSQRKPKARSRTSIYTETDASQSRKKSTTKKKSDTNYTPVALGGIAGLRRVAAKGGFFTRLNASGIPEMIDRSGDGQRRLAAHDYGRKAAKINAQVREITRTGVGRSTPMQAFTAQVEGGKWRTRSSGTFPQGEPSGRRPIGFRSPGNLAQALEAGTEARRGGRPRTAGPATRLPSSGGGTGRGGSRVDGLRGGGGGGGEGGIFKKRIR